VPDNTTIGTGVSPGTTTIASDEIGGVQYQRVKLAVGADGAAVDVSDAAPIPTKDAATKSAVDGLRSAMGRQVNAIDPATTDEIRGSADNGAALKPRNTPAAVVHNYLPTGQWASPAWVAGAMDDAQTGNNFSSSALMLFAGSTYRRARADATTGGLVVTTAGAVDTELPPAAALTDTDAGSVPSVGARGMLLDVDAGTYRRARASRSGGGDHPAVGTAATTNHLWDTTSAVQVPQRTAKSATDADSGYSLPAAGNMVFDGTAWQRERAPFSEVAIARGVRAAPDPATVGFVTSSPSIVNRGFAGAVFLLKIWAAPTAAAGQGLTLKILGAGAGGTGSQALLTQLSSADAGLAKQPGVYCYVVYPGASATQTGAAPLAGVSAVNSAPETPVVCSPLPLTPRFSVGVYHRGAANTFDWDYEVSVAYVR
jgi:hypothetical protein